MKPFRFPLEAVLETRRAQETSARQELAVSLEKQRIAFARSQDAAQALDTLLQQISHSSSGRFSVADRERSWSLKQAQEKICAELRVAAQECAKLSEIRRQAVLAARRNRELLEKLREAKSAVWTREAAQAEQHLFDEFAMTRRHQAAQQGASSC